MKAFVNLLIKDESASSAEEILDTVLAALEEEGVEVIWSKCGMAND